MMLFSFMVPLHVMAEVRKRAGALNISMAAVIREALTEWLLRGSQGR